MIWNFELTQVFPCFFSLHVTHSFTGQLREKSTMELTLYAQGSDLAPPKPDIQEGFDYAVNFATNILTNPAVIGTILKAKPIIVL